MKDVLHEEKFFLPLLYHHHRICVSITIGNGKNLFG